MCAPLHDHPQQRDEPTERSDHCAERGDRDRDARHVQQRRVAGAEHGNGCNENRRDDRVAQPDEECVAGERIAERDPEPGTVSDDLRESLVEPHLAGVTTLADSDGTREPKAVLDDLQTLLWETAGLLRDADRLATGLDRLAEIRTAAEEMTVGPLGSRSFEFAVDLGFSLTVAETVLRGALEREESRGAHYRTDFTEIDPDWQRNIHYHAADVGVTTTTEPVGEPSDEVRAALDEGHELDYHQLE